MKRRPRFDNFLADVKLGEFARDILQSFGYIPDVSIYSFQNVTWSVPFSFSVPLYGGQTPRTISPDVVRCARAVDLSSTTTPVHFGACTWSWTSNQVVISDVAGLVVGASYNLVFEVISQ
jgi:hypothetical protein